MKNGCIVHTCTINNNKVIDLKVHFSLNFWSYCIVFPGIMVNLFTWYPRINELWVLKMKQYDWLKYIFIYLSNEK